jgi:O-antigen/teichoic acid export membrane protein
LFQRGSLHLARALFLEGRPNWCFNLTYAALTSMSLPMCYLLLGQRESGYYRAAAMIVFSVQVFLAYFAFMLNPRIVAWRHEAPHAFRRRILGLVGGVVLAGLAVFGALWLVRRPTIALLCGREFLPAASLLPVMVFAKFLAVASGLVVWALFASQRDWQAVACAAPPVVAGLALNWWLLPRGGTVAAAWLYWLMELALLVLCLSVFCRLKVPPAGAAPSAGAADAPGPRASNA